MTVNNKEITLRCITSFLVLFLFVGTAFASGKEYPRRPEDNIHYLGIESYANIEIYNWAENIKFIPEVVFYPKSKQEVIKIINDAREQNKHITIMGRGHSWNPLMKGADYLISTLDMTQVWVDEKRKTVTVEAGANVGQVDAILRQHNMSLPCNIIGATEITIGGIVSTGSHGSGQDCQTMSDILQSVELIKSDGTSEIISENTHGKDYMNAVRLSLGTFGLLYKLTLRVNDDFNVEVVDKRYPLDETMDVLPDIIKNNHTVEVLWTPFSDEVMIKSWKKTKKKRTLPSSWEKAQIELRKKTLHIFYSYFLSPLFKDHPESVVWVNQKISPLRFPSKKYVTDVAQAIHYVNEGSRFPINETEAAIPMDVNNLENIRMAWDAIINSATTYRDKNEYPLNVVAHMRFTKGSDALLSPSYGNRATCYIDFGSFSGTPGWGSLVNHIWTTWQQIPEIKLHWAKDMLAYNHLDINHMYGKENIDKFLLARHEADPNNMFLNGYVKQVFAINS